MSADSKLTHLDEKGRVSMVDVSSKKDQVREATARGHIILSSLVQELIRSDSVKKGNVFTTAELAGIGAAKRCSELIPLCHQIALTSVKVKCDFDPSGVVVTATARSEGKTGVEMEALTAVSVALLTIYDMVKAVDKSMVLSDITLLEKTKKDRENSEVGI